MLATPNESKAESVRRSRDQSAVRSHWSSPKDIVRSWWRAIKFAGRVRESGLFDESYYLSQYEKADRPWISPLFHYLVFGANKRVNPHPLFDGSYYLEQNPDIFSADINPLIHYLTFGNGRPHRLFDVEYYFRSCPERQGTVQPLIDYLNYGWRQGWNPHLLFDGRYYLSTNPDVEKAQISPLLHYARYGWLEGRNPHPLFDIEYYFTQCPQRRRKVEPLNDYLTYGWRQGWNPHPLFDGERYLSANPEVRSTDINPLVHYIEYGWQEGRSPHPLFDCGYYATHNPDIVDAPVNPLVHFVSRVSEFRVPDTGGSANPHPLFDVDYYLSQCPERRGKTNPLMDYVAFGWKQGWNPHPLFDGRFYLLKNPEIGSSGLSPLQHYVDAGWREGRNPHPLFDVGFYLSQNPDVERAAADPLIHFVLHGAREGRDPNPYFEVVYYLRENPDVQASGANPLIHFLTAGASEGRKPNPVFDPLRYSAKHSAASPNGVNPLVAYLSARPPFDLRNALMAELQTSKRPALDDDQNANPLVSVIVRCMVPLVFLEDAILSALLACSRSMEIILVLVDVHDAQSMTHLNNLERRYRFTVVRELDGKQDRAWTEGIQQARGQYIQLMEQDVLLAPGKIDLQIEELSADSGLDACMARYEICDADGIRHWDARRTLGATDPSSFYEEGASALPLHPALFRRRVFDQCGTEAIESGEGIQGLRAILSTRMTRLRYSSEVLSVQRMEGIGIGSE
jgi:hypothetical protein